MSMWRIRVAVPDDAASRGALTSALAGQAVSGLKVISAEQEQSSLTTSEIVVDLPRDDGLATMLSALHEISPHVFVSRADAAVAEAAGAAAEFTRARYGV